VGHCQCIRFMTGPRNSSKADVIHHIQRLPSSRYSFSVPQFGRYSSTGRRSMIIVGRAGTNLSKTADNVE
jgi:hypothetical protein